MTPLYFAPINLFGNYIYRHLLLQHECDFVFSELIMIDRLDNERKNDKFKIVNEDIKNTIFQIGAGNEKEITLGVETLHKEIDGICEINLNMGCPNSSMQKRRVCGGLLHDTALMGKLCKQLTQECNFRNIIPSAKIRIGTSENILKLQEYITIIKRAGIKKIYVHMRPLRYPYSKQTMYNVLNDVEYNEIELILNGDIDSYNAYEQISNKYKNNGIMIGRCALYNPLIFKQILSKEYTKNGDFDPIAKDLSLEKNNGKISLTKQKKDIILQLIKLVINYDGRIDILNKNLSYLMKGISNSTFMKKINTEKNITPERVLEIFSKTALNT